MRLIVLGILFLLLVTVWFLFVRRCNRDWFGCGHGHGHGRRHSLEDPYTEFGTILRSKVPKATRLALDRYNTTFSLTAGQIPTLPTTFDARTAWPGLITGPLDQGSCGSCWAFAITTASSDRIRIKNPTNVTFNQMIQYRGGTGQLFTALNNLDPYQLAACELCTASPVGSALASQSLCGTGTNNAACKGQVLQVAMQYMQTTGIIDVNCSPRQVPCIANYANCIYNCDSATNCEQYKPTSIFQINDDLAATSTLTRSDTMRTELMQNGPLVIGISIYQSFMDFFQNPANVTDVYTQAMFSAGSSDVLGGHAVVVVGWGTDDNGVDYWLIRNSWSSAWGDQGYFRIERGVNLLGIGNDCWASEWGSF